MPVASSLLHIDDVSRDLEEWVRQTLSGTDADIVHVCAPLEIDDENGADRRERKRPTVEILFNSIVKEKPDGARLNRDDAFLLNYRLRVRIADVLDGQHILSEIFFAAGKRDDYEIAPLQEWPEGQGPAFGGPDGRSLILKARLVRPSDRPADRLVTVPLGLELRGLGRISGQVTSSTGAPIMRAQVEARSLNKRVTTDHAGRFVLSGAPHAGTVALVVTARNRFINVSVDVGKQADIVIVMPMEDEHA